MILSETIRKAADDYLFYATEWPGMEVTLDSTYLDPRSGGMATNIEESDLCHICIGGGYLYEKAKGNETWIGSFPIKYQLVAGIIDAVRKGFLRRDIPSYIMKNDEIPNISSLDEWRNLARQFNKQRFKALSNIELALNGPQWIRDRMIERADFIKKIGF